MRRLYWQNGVLLGRGAFGEVYRVEDTRGNIFACKISARKDILCREAQMLKELQSEVFARFYDYWEEGEKGFLLMECFSGINLDRYLRQKGPMTQKQVVDIGLMLAVALDRLHNSGKRPVIFRDIKPENLILDEKGMVRIVDLGCVCSMGKSQGVAGTMEFAAPEQLKPDGLIGTYCDVYGLGKTMLTLTGGRGSKRFRQIMKRCTETDPAMRIQNMGVLVQLLKNCRKPYFLLSDMDKAYLKGDVCVFKNILEKS